MNSIQWSVCRAFIDKRAKETKESLLSFLPSEQKKEFSSALLCSSDLTLGFNQVRHLLQWTHYSWFAPFLRTLSENEISIFLSAFPEEKAKQLTECLLLSSPPTPLPPASKAFIQKKIIEALLVENPNLPPIEALPASSLKDLSDLTSENLSLLIDFLGLYDLAIEMRLVIDTVKIKKIKSILSKEEVFFLSLISGRQDPPLFKQAGLSLWNGNTKDLLTLLHKRGMNRLAKVLYPEDPNFVYYIKLRMSSDQAAIFSPLHKKSEHAKTYKILAGQIMDVLTFFKKYNIRASS
ncbi:MAG: hypothetical protein V4489_09985 [Chlamydiota bacterium]